MSDKCAMNAFHNTSLSFYLLSNKFQNVRNPWIYRRYVKHLQKNGSIRYINKGIKNGLTPNE